MVKFIHISIALILLILAKFRAAGTVFFSTPANNSNWAPGGEVSVTVNFGSTTQRVLVSQTCGTDLSSQFVYSEDPTVIMNLPQVYTGQCVYSGTQDITSTNLTPIYINVFSPGNVSISTTNSTVPAGSSTNVDIVFSPTSSGYSGIVTLTCAGLTPSSQIVTTTTCNFPIPANFYGNCVFSADFINYISVNTANIVITQN